MIVKLLKHEILRTWKPIAAAAGIGTLVVIAAVLFMNLDIPVLSDLLFGLAFLAVIALVPGTQLMLAIDHYRTSFGKEAYLTHSLPVAGGKIHTAKFLWACIVSFALAAIALVLFSAIWPTVATQNPGAPATLWDGLSWVFDTLTALWPLWLQIAVAVTAAILLLTIPTTVYFALAVGNEARLRRFGMGGVVIAFVALYLVQQLVYAAAIFAVPWGIGLPEHSEMTQVIPVDYLAAATSDATPEAFPVGMLVASVILFVVTVWRTHYSWQKKISLA